MTRQIPLKDHHKLLEMKKALRADLRSPFYTEETKDMTAMVQLSIAWTLGEESKQVFVYRAGLLLGFVAGAAASAFFAWLVLR